MIDTLGSEAWIFNPKPYHIDIERIAHNLSFFCRFGGDVKFFYPVTQHCVIGSYYSKYPLEFLLHDAAEAFIGDLRTYIKKKCPEFQTLEDKLMSCVVERFGLEPLNSPVWNDVKEVDLRMLKTEFRDVAKTSPMFELPYTYINEKILPWRPETSKLKFLNRFYELYNGKNTK